MSRSAMRLAAAVALAASASVPALAAAATHSHFDCRVTSSTRLKHLGREGQQAELSRFTCHVHGGPLDGFTAMGTNIWEPGKRRDVLLGSIGVARKGDAAVVYEVEQATRTTPEGTGAARAGGGRGVYKLATGSAAALAGKSFRTIAHGGGDTFALDLFIDE